LFICWADVFIQLIQLIAITKREILKRLNGIIYFG
jgi:hypothetical protein